MMAPKDYAGIADQYAKDVVRGEIVACKLVIAACQRQLDDIVKFDDGDEYIWNPELTDSLGRVYRPADRVCGFIERLPHVKGKWAGTLITLEPWQVFTIAVPMGWVRPNGKRRFKYAYDEEARKNGKTTKLAALCIYFTLADGEKGAEVYAVATKSDQAKLLWEPARRMIEHVVSADLREHYGVETYRSSIVVEDTFSSFKYLGSDSNTSDGFSVSMAAIDELHAHTRGMFDVIDTGTGAREQPMVWMITTAGTNQAGVCYEQRDYVRRILEGTLTDDSYFGIIYTIDDADIHTVWSTPEVWIKANPNLGVSVLEHDFKAKLHKARQTPPSQANFLTKHLNVWCSADSAWMDMWKWQACHDASLRIEDFYGCSAVLGADFASKIDIAAITLLFEEDGVLYPFSKYYLPDAAVQASSNDQYDGWAREGLFTITPGEIIDFDYIINDCNEMASKFEVECFGYDPHQATMFATTMINEGWNMVEVRPSVLNFSEPMKELSARATAKTLKHNDPILSWMVSNVVCFEDAKANIYPRRSGAGTAKAGNPANKIDGVISLLTALNRRMQPAPTSIYEKRGLRVC